MRLRDVRALVLGLVLALGAASALAQNSLPQGARVPAPEREPATGLNFPESIAEARKGYSVDYGRGMNRPELGYAWHYDLRGLLSATIYVYDMAIQPIADGPGGAPVKAQFQQALSDIHQAAAFKGYRDMRTVEGPTLCRFGTVAFNCVTLSAQLNGLPVYLAVLVTGYRNRFVKVRLDWRANTELSQPAVDRFLQTLVGTILR